MYQIEKLVIPKGWSYLAGMRYLNIKETEDLDYADESFWEDNEELFNKTEEHYTYAEQIESILKSNKKISINKSGNLIFKETKELKKWVSKATLGNYCVLHIFCDAYIAIENQKTNTVVPIKLTLIRKPVVLMN